MHSRLSNEIKAEASRLGFYACGIARAESVHDDDARAVIRWLDANGHADMEYMGRNLDKRLNPELLMPGVKSIVCVAMNYTPAKRIPEDEYQFAAYAYGKDYHDIVKQKLHQLALFVEQSIPDATLPLTYRCFCDSAPVLERYWAVKAGIGWIGRNHQLIIPKAGSMFVLGELFLNVELECDSPIKNGCGDCHKCLDVCPTKVLSLQSFDASKCLSYQLIENRQGLSEEATHGERHLRMRPLPTGMSVEPFRTSNRHSRPAALRRISLHDKGKVGIPDRRRLSAAVQRLGSQARKI